MNAKIFLFILKRKKKSTKSTLTVYLVHFFNCNLRGICISNNNKNYLFNIKLNLRNNNNKSLRYRNKSYINNNIFTIEARRKSISSSNQRRRNKTNIKTQLFLIYYFATDFKLSLSSFLTCYIKCIAQLDLDNINKQHTHTANNLNNISLSKRSNLDTMYEEEFKLHKDIKT